MPPGLIQRGSLRREEFAPRSVSPHHMAMASVFAGTFSTFSTTVVDTWITPGSTDIEIVSRRSHFYVPLSTKVAHSVANGRFGMGLWLYDVDRDTFALTNGVTAWSQEDISVGATANEWRDISPLFSFSGDTDHVNHGEGRHRLYLVFKNQTAGTLYVGISSQTNTMFGFMLGKA